MRPSYEELIVLNPLLVNKAPEEIDALLNAIEECGYVWDDKSKSYYNAEIDRSIRTQGLDLFTPNRIREIHAEMLAGIKRDPEGYAKRVAGMKLWQMWTGKLSGLFTLTLLFGWILLPIKYWLGSLVIIIFLFLILRTISFGKVRSYKEDIITPQEIKKEVKEEMTYQPKEEQIGPDVGYKDDGSDVKYQAEFRKDRIKEKIKRNWKDYLIIFLSILIVFSFWRGFNLAKQNLMLEKELNFIYLGNIKEKLVAPTEEECMDLYGTELEKCPEIKVLK